MNFRFASIARPNRLAYLYDDNAWGNSAPISFHMLQYETYGDGLSQHSPEYPILQEVLTDYLASLASAMKDETALVEACLYEICRWPSDAEIEFCASVKYKPAKEGTWRKPVYFSRQLRKISTSDSKQHDKRYAEVDEWCDGTPEAVYRMLIPEYAVGIQMFTYAYAIREWFLHQPSGSGWMEMPSVFLKWHTENEAARQLKYAYEACYGYAKALRIRHEADQNLDNVRRYLAPKVEEVAEKVAS
jgi:hypothetical protein